MYLMYLPESAWCPL